MPSCMAAEFAPFDLQLLVHEKSTGYATRSKPFYPERILRAALKDRQALDLPTLRSQQFLVHCNASESSH